MWILSQAGTKIFLSLTVFRPAFLATQPFKPRTNGGVFPGDKATGALI